MADIYNFTSSRKAAYSKYHPSVRSRLKLCKKRKPSRMDFRHQHACVAHFEEPTFCPSGIASIFPQYSSVIRLPELDDESPFVSKEPTTDPGATGESRDRHESSGFDAGVEPASLQSSQARFGLPWISRLASPLQCQHPRPESQEAWDEEDGRRLRFALSDDIEDEILRRRLTRTVRNGDQTSESTASSTRLHPNPISAGGDLPSVSATQAHLASVDDAEDYSVLDEPNFLANSDSRVPHALVDHTIDDDAIAVDDPRRSYDFADFLERWRLLSLTDEQLPSFRPSLRSPIRLERPSEDLTRRQLAQNDLDMQGLSWKTLGVDRDDALEARQLLHPYRNSSPCSNRYRKSDMKLQWRCEYQPRASSPRHRPHISHYQLRNLLAASNRSDIFYSTGNKVIQTSLACPALDHAVMDLSESANSANGFRITCLSTTQAVPYPEYQMDSVLIAGGFYGEYALLGLRSSSDQTHEHGWVTHAYNGIVTYAQTYKHRHSGLLTAAFCSNDHKVHLMDVKTLQFTNTFTYDNAINCCAMSPDGRLRVVVGDTRETLITDAEKGDVLVTLREHDDYGFACAWSPDHRKVATAAQDGTTVIWDVRHWSKPLQTVGFAMSFARSLHFTDDNMLVIAEEDDVVSIIDPMDTSLGHDLRFFGPIAGVALLDGGSELLIASADATVGGLYSFERLSQGLGKGTQDQDQHQELFV